MYEVKREPRRECISPSPQGTVPGGVVRLPASHRASAEEIKRAFFGFPPPFKGIVV
jgi:hypothetical protein